MRGEGSLSGESINALTASEHGVGPFWRGRCPSSSWEWATVGTTRHFRELACDRVRLRHSALVLRTCDSDEDGFVSLAEAEDMQLTVQQVWEEGEGGGQEGLEVVSRPRRGRAAKFVPKRPTDGRIRNDPKTIRKRSEND